VDSVDIAPIVAEDSIELAREEDLGFEELENVELVSIFHSCGATSRRLSEGDLDLITTVDCQLSCATIAWALWKENSRD
jgi:hypothetical protein